MKFENIIQNFRHLMKCCSTPSSMPDTVALAGEEILLALYGATSMTLSLNTHIRHCFMKAVATCPIQLGALTPTSLAAREHSWHVYHQVHSWLGNDPLPSDLGWDLVNGQLCPVFSCLTPAPDALLNLIS